MKLPAEPASTCPRLRDTTYVHLVPDGAAGLHGVVVDECHHLPGATVAVRPTLDDDGRVRFVLVVTPPPSGDEGPKA